MTRLRPLLFLPGDYVVRRGDIGKEMFIVNSGQVQVVGGPQDSIVFVTLKAGPGANCSNILFASN